MAVGVEQEPGAATASPSKCLVMCFSMFLRERACPPAWCSEEALFSSEF